jgi:hypothetical protein
MFTVLVNLEVRGAKKLKKLSNVEKSWTQIIVIVKGNFFEYVEHKKVYVKNVNKIFFCQETGKGHLATLDDTIL